MIQTRKSLQIWTLVAVVLLCVLILPIQASGMDTEKTQVGFYISASLPDNQRNNGNTYYDLHMQPNDEQEISFFIGNTGTEPIVVNLQINNAYTNTAGDIGFQIHGIKDESLLVAMEDIAQLSQTKVELAPDENKELFITMKMPAEPFDGEIIGGIVATKEITQQDKETSSAIINEYSYIIGLVVSENEEIVNPEITFAGVKAELVNYRTAAIHSIRNSTPVLMNDVTMHIDIFKEGDSEAIWSLSRENIKLAPSSLLDYTFYLGEENIKSGSYESRTKIIWQEQQWEFTDTFDIEPSTASRLNSDAIHLDSDANSIISKPIAILLVSFLMLVLLTLIIIVVRMFRKIDTDNIEEKKDENEIL